MAPLGAMTLKIVATFLMSVMLHTFITPKPRETQSVNKFLEDFNRAATENSRLVTVHMWRSSTGKIYNNEKALIKKPVINWNEFKLKQAILARSLDVPPNLGSTQRRLLQLIRANAYSKNKTLSWQLASVASRLYYQFITAQVFLDNGRPLGRGKNGVLDFFSESSNFEALASVWKKWRDASGKRMRGNFAKLVRLWNSGARENGYTDYGYFEWFSDFEDRNFNSKVVRIMSDVRPLFLELHAFVRYKLSQKYRGRFDPAGPIPSHLLGDPWGQAWDRIFHLVQPYPTAAGADVTAAMRKRKWSPMRMLKAAEEFFTSLGFPAMTEKFWKRSIFEKPENRPAFDCHGSAWDFDFIDDFRIKMCAKVTQRMLRSIHHEMGHIQYFMAYTHLPYAFRKGANSAFHEAIGETIELSVLTPKHLQRIGLMTKGPIDKKVEINALLRAALMKVAFLPFALTVDAWRWRVFNATIPPHSYNRAWWRLRRDLQGLQPPVRRSEADFDPGSKYHVARNVPYIRYFVSVVLQFQFFEAMCRASGHAGPLHRCDFYRSVPAGNLMRKMMALGRSKPWPVALEAMTGQREMDVGPMKRYFAPLEAWLKKRRAITGYPLGW